MAVLSGTQILTLLDLIGHKFSGKAQSEVDCFLPTILMYEGEKLPRLVNKKIEIEVQTKNGEILGCHNVNEPWQQNPVSRRVLFREVIE